MNDPDIFTNLCTAVGIPGAGDLWGIAAGLFLAGLTGGFLHCLGMCGPFVMAQVSARLETVPARNMGEFHRLSGGLLLPYHLGRMTTYTALGGAAAVVSGSLDLFAGLSWVPVSLLSLAALFFAAQAAKGWGLRLVAIPNWTGKGAFGRALGKVAKPLFAHPVGWRGYLLGVLLGFLPCGLVYGAVAAAAAANTAPGGAIAMTAFTLGTVPALALAGIAGQLAADKFEAVFRRLGPFFLLFSALLLALTAWRIA